MPTADTVQKALVQIGKSAANYRYFFENLKSASWLAPLAQAGLFTNPPGHEPLNGGFIFPTWPASQYLARMAKIPAAQAEVLCIVLAMHETENVNVHSDLLDIALALPAKDAAKLVGRARLWVHSPYQGLARYDIGDLIAHLANGGQPGPALQMAKEVFALLPSTPPKSDEDSLSLLPEPRAWLDDWHYEETLKKAVPGLVVGDAHRTLELFCDLLAQAMVLSRKSDDARHEDYSYIWHDAIEHDEHPARLRNSLISAVRKIAEQAIKRAPEHRTTVFDLLRRHQWTVFKRIDLHLLREFLNLTIGEVAGIAPTLVELEGSARHEEARLLASAFPLLPAAAQQAVLQRIMEGPEEEGVVKWLRFVKVEPTPEQIADFNLRWRAQRLTLIEKHVPPAWRSQVDDILARAGSVRRPDEVPRSARWVGPTSPKTKEDLLAMSPAQAVEYLREWTPPPGPFEATPEGLGRVLSEVVPRRLEGYVAQAAEFRTVDPTFVRFLFSSLESAIKAKQTFAWPPILALAQWVVEQPRQIPARHKALMDADPDWGWTRGTIATLLEAGLNEGPAQIPFDQRDVVWGIIEPLTKDPDPTPEHEQKYGGENMDPSTMAINTVRGKALHTVVAYALWVRRYLDKLPAPPALTFGAMPEVRGVLDAHLDTGRDPSLTIRSLYGRFFPWLQDLDREWAQAAAERIFPSDAAQAGLYAAAWDAYLVFCAAYSDVLPVLRAQYARAVANVAAYNPATKRRLRPEQHLGEHLIAYFWQGNLALDDSLLVHFFLLAPDALRAHIIGYAGRSLANTKQALASPFAQRLREFWEWRLRTAQQSGNLMAYREELAEFGWWFGSRKLDDTWTLAQVRAVLDLTGQIEPDFQVGETLEALAPDHLDDAVMCVARMVEASRQDWTIYGIRNHITAILKLALGSDNVTAKVTAERLVQYLVGRGHFEYRGLLS